VAHPGPDSASPLKNVQKKVEKNPAGERGTSLRRRDAHRHQHR